MAGDKRRKRHHKRSNKQQAPAAAPQPPSEPEPSTSAEPTPGPSGTSARGRVQALSPLDATFFARLDATSSLQSISSSVDSYDRLDFPSEEPPPLPTLLIRETKIVAKAKDAGELPKPGPSGGDINTPSPSASMDSVVHKPELRSLQDTISRRRREMRKNPASGDQPPVHVFNPYEPAEQSIDLVRKKTGYLYDANMLEHKCLWDKEYPEKPARIEACYARMVTLGLTAKLHEVRNRERADVLENIVMMHDDSHVSTLKLMCQSMNAQNLEVEASRYDAVYFHPETYNCALRAVEGVLNMADAIGKGVVQNGVALVRPPGHHASRNEYNGYCFFNNVAIAAEYCIRRGYAQKVMILDFDVHHGQGTQRLFYDRNDVLYISIHRYEHGKFWPNLRESDFNHVGSGVAKGFNVNIPLNDIGLGDKDYMAILLSIILPIATEFNPGVILMSAGYDACMGCPEGRMKLTPGVYGHIVRLLSNLAQNRLLVALEGGYFIPTLVEGFIQTVKVLSGDPCAPLEKMGAPEPSVIQTICSVKRVQMNYWRCFTACPLAMPLDVPIEEHPFEIIFLGQENTPPFPTRACYPVNTGEFSQQIQKEVRALRYNYGYKELPVAFAYEEDMAFHKPEDGIERPERPERIDAIIKQLREFGLYDRMIRVQHKRMDVSEMVPHHPRYIEKVTLNEIEQTNDTYSNDFTGIACHVAISTIVTLINYIFKRKCGIAFAIIRPPGHHAEFDRAMGFCFFNNVVAAAQYALQTYELDRILIIDFDVHHGNGIQNAFYDNKKVLYISIHRHDGGEFFPTKYPSNFFYDGHGEGKGFNVNIPFNGGRMGDTEYLAVMHNIVLPLAYAYAPQMVILAAGFDAGINDPLGGYHVSPEMFGHMLQMLRPLACERMLVCLEGGYNLTTLGYSFAMCAKAALNDPLPKLTDPYKEMVPSAIDTIRNVINHFKQYWPILSCWRELSSCPLVVRRMRNMVRADYNTDLTRPIPVMRVTDTDYVEAQDNALRLL